MTTQTRYRFLDNIAIADVAFEAYGSTLAELFTNAALALLEITVNPDSLGKPNINQSLLLISETRENLLYDFLSELIYLRDTAGLLVSSIKVKIIKNHQGWQLKGTVGGVRFDPQKHQLRTEAKAVTKHMFEIKQATDGYTTTVVLDI